MARRPGKPPEIRRDFRHVWDELAYVCRAIHYWRYLRKKVSKAKRCQKRLPSLLQNLPDDDDGMAIVRAEGHAIVHEIHGNVKLAIKFRRREIELMEKLHEIAEEENYSDSMRVYVFAGRGLEDLNVRRTILERLEGSAMKRGLDA